MNEFIDGFSVESILALGAKGIRFVLILALAALLSRVAARLVGELV